MASYKKTVHTDKAFALIGKMVAGDISKLEFTKIKVSDKDYSKHTEDELKKLTALEQIKQETSVSEKTPVGDNAVNIHGIIYNTDLQNSYYLRTIGLYANDPDEGEILYSVTATEVGDYIPTPNGNNITTAIIDILTEISDAEVNLSGNPSALVDVSMLNKKLDRGEGLEKEFDSAVKIVAELKKKQNKEDGTLKTVVKTIVGGINELFDNKLEKGGYTGTAQNLLTEISKITSKSVLGRIIIGKGLSVDSSGRTSVVSKNDGIIVNENDIQLNTVDNVTTDSGTKPLSARQGKKLEENKQNKNDSALLTTAKNIVGAINELFSGKANKAHSHGNSEITDIDASKIKSGTIDISRLPQAALERCVVVADDTARFKLTKSQVQVGDSVKVTSPDNLMYIVVDDNKLNVEAGYVAYSAAVKWGTIKDKPSTFPPSAHTQDWSTITGKPSSFTPSGHTHTKNQITDFPSSLKNPSALTIQANGTSLGSYDGSTAKTFNITASNVGASPSNHNHDNTYAKLNHGSHIPATLAANNKKFLRCDNTWVDVTPANIGAEPTIGTKQNAFNKPFGTAVNTILEGAKLAETLGIPYGGGLNNSNTKTAGYAYYDSTTKKTYKCTVTNTLNYADASKFEAISNADLLAKFQNLLNNGENYCYIGSLLIQWGTLNGLKANTTIYQNFPKSFKDTNYSIVYQKISADHSNNTPMKTSAKEKNRFGIYSFGVYSVSWFAIGY